MVVLFMPYMARAPSRFIAESLRTLWCVLVRLRLQQGFFQVFASKNCRRVIAQAKKIKDP